MTWDPRPFPSASYDRWLDAPYGDDDEDDIEACTLCDRTRQLDGCNYCDLRACAMCLAEHEPGCGDGHDHPGVPRGEDVEP